MTNGTNSNGWLLGIGGAIAGTVVGSLILRGLGLQVLSAKLDALIKAHEELTDRVSRVEGVLLGQDRRSRGRPE